MEKKLCRICGKIKDLDYFTKSGKMKDGHRNECKECSNKLYNDKEKRKERDSLKEIKIDGNKICRICKIEKPINDFHMKKGTPDGHRNECKECVKKIQLEYKDNPDFKEKRKEYDKNRYEEKREEILERKKEYHIENRKEILINKKEYRDKNNNEIFKKWRENNLEVMAIHQAKYREKYPHVIAWRSVLHSTLKRLGSIKETHTIDMLGYSAIELKEHIEKQFVEGMTWNNHGKWDIDHITPVTFFDNKTDIKLVCALENLQPLWAFDNLSKSNKIL